MKFNILNLEIIRSGVAKRIEDIAKKYPNFNDAFDNSNNVLQGELGVEESDKVGVEYSKFLLRVGVLSYFGILENDVNMIKLKASEQERLNKVAEGIAKSEEEKGSTEEDQGDGLGYIPVEVEGKVIKVKQELDFKFGYQGYSDILTSLLESILNTTESEKKVKVTLETNLLGNIRDIDVETYRSNPFYLDSDISLITLLGRKPPIDLHEEILKLIETNHTYHGYCTQLESSILSVYKYALQDSFGLRPYKGVVIKASPFVYTISDNFDLITIPNARNAFAPVSEFVLEKLNIVVKTDRQFDIKGIINGDHSVTQYYPKKILEYTMGRELTTNLATGVYKPHAKNKSWEEYEEAYVKEQIVQYIREAIYYSLEKNINFKESSLKQLNEHEKGADFSFKSDEIFKDVYSQNVDLVNKELLTNPRINKALKEDLLYFQKCLCTMVCVIKYNSVGEQVNALGIRVVDTNNSLNERLSKSIFEPLSTNLNTIYRDGLVVSEGKTVDGVTPLPYTIYEYKHDFNEALSNAEPLFGYTAVELYINRGVPIKWDKILLGEDAKGTPFFASLKDKDDVQLQGNLVHNMIAGSRAGKGVQTMNILGSGLASNKPIFYLDNKPDMAVMFNQISGGNMFIVQGGNFGDNADKNFTDDGDAIKGWDTHYNKLPQYVKDSFFPKKTYADEVGNMVYYRALMLVLGIILARVASASNNPEVYTNLGGENGIILVVDEYKAWQKFEQDFFSYNGTFGGKFRGLDELESKLADLQDNLSLEQDKLATLEPGKTTYINTEGKISKIKKSINGLIRPEEAYATQMIYKLGETLVDFRASAVAGMRNTERFCSDIFVIAQDLKEPFDLDKVTSTIYTRRTDGTLSAADKTGNLQKHSLTRGLFDYIDHDWFVGANLKDNIAGSTKDEKFTGLVNEARSYWIYIPEKGNNTQTLLEGKCSNETIFKPYLVLNNSKEDDPNNTKKILGMDKGKPAPIPDPEYSYVAQCRGRINKAVPGLWEEVRLKHLSDKDREEAESGINKHYGDLNPGIGFEGLVNLIKQSNNLGAFNPSVDLGGSAKIANYVAVAMGYSDYKDLLYDFSPEGIFSAVDVKNALLTPEVYADVDKRLPVLSKFGFLGGGEYTETNREDPELHEGGSDSLREYAEQASGAGTPGTDTPNENDNPEEVGTDIPESNEQTPWYYEELGISDEPDSPEEGTGTPDTSNGGSSGEGLDTNNEFSTASEQSTPREEANNHQWSEEDRVKLAEFMVGVYLNGVKIGDIDKYNKLSNQNLRPSLVNVMYGLLLEEGY